MSREGDSSMRSWRVAAIQTVSGSNIVDNLAAAGRMVAEAVGEGADMVALPEYFPLLSADERAKVLASEHEGSGPIQDFLRELAQRHDVWLVGGTIPLVADEAGKVRNSVLVYDALGRQCARYDKIHLFGFRNGAEQYDEARTIEAGSQVVSFESPIGRVGLSVCYDLRFPELYRAMGEVSVIIVPSAFTATTGRAHWETLLRARAIENQCYVMAPAQGGKHPGGRVTWGHTMIIDPWGEILACRHEGEGVVFADVELDRIDAVRAQLPALAHRRLPPARE